MTGDGRFYGERAAWWPLVSPPDDYVEVAEFAAQILRSAANAVGDVLELGRGGGSNAAHLKGEFAMTLVDLSEGMLDVSRTLNSAVEHI